MEEQDYFTLYLDETGDHTIAPSEDIGKRYLGLCGPVLNKAQDIALNANIDEFRRKHLPCHGSLPVLHRKEIMQCRGFYTCLLDPDRRASFNSDLIEILSRSDYRVLGVVIDKAQHGKKTYRKLTHPYHYCLHALLERYCSFLRLNNAKGKVVAEARGKSEDWLLREEYERVWKSGTRYLNASMAQSTLASNSISICKKSLNIVGLQIADLIAHPITRDVLKTNKRITDLGSPFAEQLACLLRIKYHRSTGGRINGFGRVFLS